MVTKKGKSLSEDIERTNRIDPYINPINNIIEQNGQKVKTQAEQCMEEVQEILDKYNCEIICRPQIMYGQTVYAPMIAEIKK